MMNKIISTCNKADFPLVLEIGSNSDLILENSITDNLPWTISSFIENSNKGFLTFPTKFDMVDPILNLNHDGRIIVRMSVNPDEIINSVEFGTSRLKERIIAINKLAEADFSLGILVAPIILVDDWKDKYEKLFIFLNDNLCNKAKKKVFFEFILMTYSYIHKMINSDAFPNAIDLYDKDKMRVRGYGKYAYNDLMRKEAEVFFTDLMKRFFPDNEIKYMV